MALPAQVTLRRGGVRAGAAPEGIRALVRLAKREDKRCDRGTDVLGPESAFLRATGSTRGDRDEGDVPVYLMNTTTNSSLSAPLCKSNAYSDAVDG
jgi:hypothetical protein